MTDFSDGTITNYADPNIYFIGGASGSGKTTVMDDLKDILGADTSVYDFDDIGVPENADKKWRQASSEAWLQKLLQKSNNSCLLGQIVLGEILACPSAKLLSRVNFCLLDVDDFERIQRLRKRATYGIDQNMLNWAAWLRMHHQDPQWAQDVLKNDAWDNLDFSAWDHLQNWCPNANIKLLNTTDCSVRDVAEKLAEWVAECSVTKLEN